MGTPFDVAAGAAGFVSVGVLLIQGCLRGFVLLSTAQNFGQDADLIRCEIEFEQYRLFRWVDKVGLETDSPNRNLNWAIINDILKQLGTLMNDTSKFKKEYGLEVITTDDRVSPDDLAIPKTGLRRLMARAKPDFANQTARILHKESSIWKRLRWAVIDKDGVEMLVSDIRGMVDKLYDLLLADDQRFIKQGIEALLRHAVSQATRSSDLSAIEQLLQPEVRSRSESEVNSVKTALSLKQRRLILDVGEGKISNSTARSSTTTLLPSNASSTTDSTSSLLRKNSKRNLISRGPLSSKLLIRSGVANRDGQNRELARYDDTPVFIEWKIVERGIESKLKHRIKSLACLLQGMDSSTFHSLTCMGYVKDHANGNYGYVFRVPGEASGGRPGDYTSLGQVLEGKAIVPTLNDRFALAIALAETVLQLHTSGWLHKGIRSENILFFQDPGGEDVDLTRAFLGGYEYARADNPSDMTEFPAMQQEINLYRHPALLKAHRESFQKSFDLFALGCVLMEIGLWATMTTILLRFIRLRKLHGKGVHIADASGSLTYAGKSEMLEVNEARVELLNGQGKRSIREQLEFSAGKVFTEVVFACLAAGDISNAAADEDSDQEEGHSDSCIDLEIDILKRLRNCRV